MWNTQVEYRRYIKHTPLSLLRQRYMYVLAFVFRMSGSLVSVRINSFLYITCHANATYTGWSACSSLYTRMQTIYRWGASDQQTGWGLIGPKCCWQQWAMNIHILLYLFMNHQRTSALLQVAGTGAAFLIQCSAVSKQAWDRSRSTADAVCLPSPCLHKWTYGLLAQGQLMQSLITHNFSLFKVSDTKTCPTAGRSLCCRNLWFSVLSSDEEKLISLPVIG